MNIETYYPTTSYPEILSQIDEIRVFARQNFIPVVLDDTARFLIENLRLYNPKRVLEIGTAIGYSGLIVLKTLKDCTLTTIELNPQNYTLAKQNFEKFGEQERVKQILGDAFEVIKSLAEQNKKFDFIFLDGPKGQYLKYLNFLEKMLSLGGVIFADDVLFLNKVDSTEKVIHKHRTMIMNLRKYLEVVLDTNKYDTKIYKIGEGVAITKPKVYTK